MEPKIGSEEQSKRQEEGKKCGLYRAAEEQREVMLAQILTSQARERLNRIALVKPEKARELENSLLQAAMQGRFSAKITEEQLINTLEKTQPEDKPGVKIVRRKGFDDDDDDDLSAFK